MQYKIDAMHCTAKRCDAMKYNAMQQNAIVKYNAFGTLQ